MHIRVNAQFYLEDRPRGYLGIRSENWQFGKNHDLAMSKLVQGLLGELFNFYMLYLSVDEANEELEKIRKWLAECSFHEHE